jgi:hypothetical protein
VTGHDRDPVRPTTPPELHPEGLGTTQETSTANVGILVKIRNSSTRAVRGNLDGCR